MWSGDILPCCAAAPNTTTFSISKNINLLLFENLFEIERNGQSFGFTCILNDESITILNILFGKFRKILICTYLITVIEIERYGQNFDITFIANDHKHNILNIRKFQEFCKFSKKTQKLKKT